jgi:hypothetical protein
LLTVALEERFEVTEKLRIMNGPTWEKSPLRVESKDDFDRDSQRPSVVERRFDRANNLYHETVTVDGEQELDKQEPLSEHRSSQRRATNTQRSDSVNNPLERLRLSESRALNIVKELRRRDR